MSIFAHHKKEKRAHNRIPFWSKVKIDIIPIVAGSMEKSETLGVENLSEGGILVETSKPYPASIPCHIHLKKNTYSPKEVILQGVVVRSVVSRRGEFFDTGISFLGLDQEQREILDQIIQLYSSPNS